MLNPRQFNLNLTFEHSTYPTEDNSPAHELRAYEKGEHRGTIEWGGYRENPDPVGFVRAWDVDEKHQNRGIGRALWAAATHFARNNEGVPLPQHGAGRTRQGEIMAQKVGKYFAPWEIY